MHGPSVKSRRRATRAVIISDLHLGGLNRPMMSRPHLLADFISNLSIRCPVAPGEALELVIAGDFIDFLALEPLASWTPDPVEARAKLTQATGGSFAAVFDALGRHVAQSHRLTVLLGNHDVELALPPVQEALLDRLAAASHELRFVTDGRAHRIGGLLIEHGNRYDDANVTDHTALRALSAAQSRLETLNHPFTVSAGSQIVTNAVNPLKTDYPFIDLLQPAGKLVALLLIALEPGYRWHINKLRRLLYGAYLAARNSEGAQPGATTHVSGILGEPTDLELRSIFGELYDDLSQPNQQAGIPEWAKLASLRRDQGVAALLARDEPIPSDRLQQIRTALQRLWQADRSRDVAGPDGQYGEAAHRLTASGAAEVVVMGHTHLPRDVRFPDGGQYINTGTWVDRFYIPAAALAGDSKSADEALTEFLVNLTTDHRDPLPPTFADIRVNDDGQVTSAVLQEVRP